MFGNSLSPSLRLWFYVPKALGRMNQKQSYTSLESLNTANIQPKF